MSTGLVGREAELRVAVEAVRLDSAVAVIGEAGIGKTSLVRAVAAAADRTLHEGGGFATLAGLPYLALRRALGRPLAGDPVLVASHVERAVGPDILFVDDLQWADDASRAVVERLAGRIQIVVAIRTGDPATDGALGLASRLGAVVVALEGLADDEAAVLLRRVAPDAPSGLIAGAIRGAGGNPLLLEEMALSRATVGVLGRGLARRRAGLGPAARDDLDLLALADRPVDTAAIGAVDELLASGLARRRGGDLEIRHALLAEGIRADFDPSTRARLHGRLAAIVSSAMERSSHLLASGRTVEAAEAARTALNEVREPRERAGLLVTLARATGGSADLAGAAVALAALSDFSAILALVDENTSPSSEEGQRALFERARALYRRGRPEAAIELARATLEHCNAGSEVAALLVCQIATLMVNHLADPGSALAYLEERMPAYAPGSGSRLRIDALRETVRIYLGETPNLGVLRQAVERAASESPLDFANRSINLAHVIHLVDGAAPAQDFAMAMSAVSREAGATATSLDILVEAVQLASFAGRFGDAVRIADEVLEQPVSPRARLHALSWRADACTFLGRFDLADGSLELARAATQSDAAERAEVQMAEINAAFWAGSFSRATATIDQLVADGGVTEVNLILPLKLGAWVDVELGRPIRDVPQADLRVLAGLVPEMAGLRALAAGDHEVARGAFDQAADLYAGFLEPDSVFCRWAAAEAVRRSGETQAAIARLQQADDLAAAMGFEAALPRIRRSLRLAGLRVPARRSAVHPIGLTAREAELVRLVETGLNNVEIARRLGLGRPTVARMLASAMAKLGVERRTQLAARELA